MEALAESEGVALPASSLELQEQYWLRVKRLEREQGP
jgi:hypothetical protein